MEGIPTEGTSQAVKPPPKGKLHVIECVGVNKFGRLRDRAVVVRQKDGQMIKVEERVTLQDQLEAIERNTNKLGK
jgi:hypothetical protein